MSELEFEPESNEEESDPDIDGDEVVERIEAQAADIRERQVDRALAQCNAHGNFTAAQERAVEVMAENMVDALLDAPREMIANADDPEKLQITLDLFDSNS